MAKVNKLALTYVKWLDSASLGSRWQERTSCLKRATDLGLEHESVGFLVCENKRSLTIAGSRQLEEFEPGECMVSDVIQIPKCAVLKRRVLKVPR